MARLSWCVVWCAVMSACSAPPVEPVLTLSPDHGSFDGTVQRVVFTLRAWDEKEQPGQGVVHLTAPVGSFIGGGEVTLTDGFATVTYACSPIDQPACVGSLKVQAEWGQVLVTSQVTGFVVRSPASVKWEVVPTSTTSQLLAVAATKDGTVWAVGERGTVLQLVDHRWRARASYVGTTLRAIALGPDGLPAIVGDDGVVLRWTGTDFVRSDVPGEDLTAIAVDERGGAHVASARGLIFSQSHGQFLPSVLLTDAPIRSLVFQDGTLWATGDGVLAKRDGSGPWERVPMPVTGRIDFAFAGESVLWLTGQRETGVVAQGLVVSGPMPTWKSSALPEPILGVVEVPREEERFVFGATRLFRQIDERSAWEAVESPVSGFVAGVSRKPGDLVLVGPPGISLLRVP